jgi:hypothetical protein
MTIAPSKTMLTKNTDKLRQEVAAHVAADRVIQGTYWDAENNRGCFIGCLNHSEDPSGAENEYGLPVVVQRIAEAIFEALPPCEAKAFFAALPNAVGCDGKDLSRVGWQFLAAELRALPDQPAEIEAAIHPVIAGMELLAAGQEWPEAAKAAAWAVAEAAKWAAKAAKAAAWAVAEAAWAAALAASAGAAARIAANAAGAARGAVRQRQRDLLLRLIAEAPVVGEVRP